VQQPAAQVPRPVPQFQDPQQLQQLQQAPVTAAPQVIVGNQAVDPNLIQPTAAPQVPITTLAPNVQMQDTFNRFPTTRFPPKPVPVSPLMDNNSGDSNAGILPLQTDTSDTNLLFPKYPPFR